MEHFLVIHLHCLQPKYGEITVFTPQTLFTLLFWSSDLN